MPSRFIVIVIILGVAPLASAPRACARDTSELVPLKPLQPTRQEVLARYGPPSRHVGADLWIYWNFPTNNPAALREGYDTLVVHVVGDEVRSMRLVRAAELRALLASVGAASRLARESPNTR